MLIRSEFSGGVNFPDSHGSDAKFGLYPVDFITLKHPSPMDVTYYDCPIQSRLRISWKLYALFILL